MSRSRFIAVFVAAITLAMAAPAVAEFARALPLNRFAASRDTQTDPAEFYAMPTAVGDDYFDGTSPVERVERHVRPAHAVGAKYLRCAFTWNAIETAHGVYDWTFWDRLVAVAEQEQIELIPYVAYTPAWAAREPTEFWKHPPKSPELYGDFMYAAAARYRGRIHSWEIWNEPDNHDYWTGTADEFASLVAIAAARIRQADPAAVLVLGGMAYGPSAFFRQLIAAHHLDRQVDVVALHAYPESWLTERAETVFLEWIPAVLRLLRDSGSGDDLWVNEMGYADYRFSPTKASLYGTRAFYGHEHTRHYQAAMLFKFEVMALASSAVSLTGWYRIDDFPRTETRLGADLVNYHLGLVDTRGRPKPAAFALSFFNRLFGPPTRLVPSANGDPPAPQAVVNVFQQKDGKVIVAGWLRSSRPEEVPRSTGQLPDRRSARVSVTLPCVRSKVIGSYDVEGRRIHSGARVRSGTLENIRLRGDRVFLAELACTPPQP